MRAIVRLLLLTFVSTFFLPCSVSASGPITACAIRWDAWYTNGPNDPAHYMALALSRPEFLALATLHAKFNSAVEITWEPTQETFDAEIHAAHKANLCWAYLMYGKDNVIDLGNSMMRGLAFHRASAIKDLVPYAMMTQSGTLGTAGKYQAAVTAMIELMKDENYQRVTVHGETRPLFFLYYNPADLKNYRGRFDLEYEPEPRIHHLRAGQQTHRPPRVRHRATVVRERGALRRPHDGHAYR